LANELFGDYHIELAKIRLWTRTPMKKQWKSSKTILSTLCHVLGLAGLRYQLPQAGFAVL